MRVEACVEARSIMLKLSVMRRFLCLLILIMLPLQWSYAAIGSYCSHERAREARQHLGHHELSPVSQDKKANDEDSRGGDRVDHCAICHFTLLKMALSFDTPIIVESTPVASFQFRELFIPDRSPVPPFRPPLSARPEAPA